MTSFINLMTHIDDRNSAAFQAIFRNMHNEGRDQEASVLALKLLKQREPELQLPVEFRKRYEFILDNLKAVYPSLIEYFARMLPGNGLNRVAISTKAQRMIFSELEKKGSLNNIKVNVCDNFDSFEKKLQAGINTFEKSDESQRCCFTLRHRRLSEPKKLSSHTTPIYLEKKNGEFRIVVTENAGNSWNKPILESIKKTWAACESKHPLKIYLYTNEKRIMDHTNCGILAIRDTVHMAQDYEFNMDWIETKAELAPNEEYVYHFQNLPPRLMNVTQSLSQIEKYVDRNLPEALIRSRSKPTGETLKQNVAKHTIEVADMNDGSLRRRNAKVAKFFLKYERMIIAKVISEGK